MVPILLSVIMNFNQDAIKRKNNRFGFSASNIKKIMGPPTRPAPKAKATKSKANSSTSSGTNWGKSCLSVINTSTLRSGSTTVTTDGDPRVILALTEGRGEARCEVGLASMDLSLSTLLLCQISDSQSYINTLTKINIVNPTDIIIPSTFLENNNRLVKKLRKQFPNINILGIPRKTFNKSNGMDRILQLCLPSLNTICVGLQHKYYALAAASAVTTYLQNNLNIYYAKGSVNVSYQESEGYAIIDFSTADRLELVSSAKPMQASRYATLFGILNYCATKIGSRLLRSTILQPPYSPSIIEQTSHSVSELIKHSPVLLSIQAILQKVSNIDQLLCLPSLTLGSTDSLSVRQLNYLLMLNGLLDVITPLKDVVETLQQPFFKQLKNTLESEIFVLISNKIRKKIRPSACFAKSEAGVTERCFAIKSDINGLLDLVRKTYVERMNDLNEYVRHLGNKLNNHQRRSFKKSDLPPEFIQVCRLAGSCTMKTEELINYSTRLEDIMSEILKISNSMIYDIVVDLKQHLGFFYKLCEQVARLDMLQSLAEASRRGSFIRPKFGEFTELVNSRHPMLDMLLSNQSVANPISICKDFNLQIITGPNGSGKSVYIRQVMLLQVMAQVGCYVPADSAIFRPMQRMFARIYLEDDMEYGASSFMLEMKEINYMMTLPAENSLFIIDELCRSTAADEGTSLALAICETFCKTPAFVYVTTHYRTIANLADAYLNVKTWHMETLANGDRPQDLILNFRYKMLPGITNLKHYGVHIVKNIWPPHILEDVYKILAHCNFTAQDVQSSATHEALKIKYALESGLRKLKSLGKLTRATINKMLNDYQNEVQKNNYALLHNLTIEEKETGEEFDTTQDFCTPDQNFNVFQPTHSNLWDNNQIFYQTSQNSLEYGSCNQQNHSQEREVFSESCEEFETSSYQNLSNFLREDSENINKLIPEVSIACSDRQLVIHNDTADCSERELDLNEHQENVNNHVVSACSEREFLINEPPSNMVDHIDDHVDCACSEKRFVFNESKDSTHHSEMAGSEYQLNKDQDNIFKSIVPVRSKTQCLLDENQNVKMIQFTADTSLNVITVYGSNVHNISVEEMQSIAAEIESASQSFLQDDDFDFSESSLYESAHDISVYSEKQDSVPAHVFPVVKVIEGPVCSSSSSESSTPKRPTRRNDESESISYSPLCSQSPLLEDNETSVLPSLPKDNTEVSYNLPSNDSVNLENISKLRDVDNITVENLKSFSTSDKAPTDENKEAKRISMSPGFKENLKSLSTSDEFKDLKSTSNFSSLKESDNSEDEPPTKKAVKTLRRPRFIPPQKMTRREIQEEFDEQDRRLYKGDMSESDLSKYLEQKFNRPSVKQLKNSKHLAYIRKTDSGVQVFPVKPEPAKKFTFKRNLSNNSAIDISIFSDKNAKCLDEFLNSDERDVKRFKFNFDSKEKEKQDRSIHLFQPNTISEYMTNSLNMPFSGRTQSSVISDNTQGEKFYTPTGYYKENKEDINNIVYKYLGEDRCTRVSSETSHGFNIFETCLLKENDLNL